MLIPFGNAKVFVVHRNKLRHTFFIENCVGEEHLAAAQHLLLRVLFRFRHQLLDKNVERHIILALEEILSYPLTFFIEFVSLMYVSLA